MRCLQVPARACSGRSGQLLALGLSLTPLFQALQPTMAPPPQLAPSLSPSHVTILPSVASIVAVQRVPWQVSADPEARHALLGGLCGTGSELAP